MDMSPSATRQPKQARAIRTRERILDRAEQAFADNGFEAASLTSDILDPSGISVGSFYHQFADKRAVLHALLDERRAWRDVSERLRSVTEQQTTLSDAVRAGVIELFDAIDEHPAPWHIHFRELQSADPEVRALIEHSWSVWIVAVTAVLQRWADDTSPATTGRLTFATLGLSGVLRSYLVGDAGARSQARGASLDGVVAACVASVTG
ncbi:MAG: TetR/AcrR family transcriptional regulator [Acidimicrobiia bacterium]